MSNNSARRLIHIISSNSWGGREQYALDLCRSLLQRKWSISVYTRNALAVDQHFISNAIDLRHIPLGGFFDLISIWSLSRDFLKEQKSTIVHVHNYKDALIAILARKLCRRTSDIRIVMTRHKATAGIDSWLFNKIYRNLDAHIFVSKLAKHQFLHRSCIHSRITFVINIGYLHNSHSLKRNYLCYTTAFCQPPPPRIPNLWGDLK